MCSTLHLLVYLYTSSEIPSCCVQLQNTASWVVFHQKRFWGWNSYDQMCLWVNFSKHNTDINHVSSFSTSKPSLKKILMIIIVRFKCLSMDVRNYTFAGVFSSLNYNSVALHTRAEKKRHGKLSTKKNLAGEGGPWCLMGLCIGLAGRRHMRAPVLLSWCQIIECRRRMNRNGLVRHLTIIFSSLHGTSSRSLDPEIWLR